MFDRERPPGVRSMVRAFSLTSDSLGYFIGYTLLHARRVVIVSPWLGNVDLRFPVNDHLESRHTSLLDAIDTLPDTEVTLVIREGEQYNDFVRDRLPEDVTLIELDDLHAKVVVCATSSPTSAPRTSREVG